MSKQVVDSVGDICWYNEEGKFHRLDGPAYERADGFYKAWYINGVHHRLDGPAIERADGVNWWFVDGVLVTESEYPAAVLLYKCKQVLES
jgi:hypothetical protein